MVSLVTGKKHTNRILLDPDDISFLNLRQHMIKNLNIRLRVNFFFFFGCESKIMVAIQWIKVSVSVVTESGDRVLKSKILVISYHMHQFVYFKSFIRLCQLYRSIK